MKYLVVLALALTMFGSARNAVLAIDGILPTGVHISGRLVAEIADEDTNGFGYAFPPGAKPVDKDDFADSGTVWAAESGHASASTPGRWPDGAGYGRSALKADARAVSSGQITHGTYPSRETLSLASFVIFSAYGSNSGTIASGGVWARAIGSVSVVGSAGFFNFGDSPAEVNVFTTFGTATTVNGKATPLAQGLSTIQVGPGPINFNFNFGTASGEIKTPFGQKKLNERTAGVAFAMISYPEVEPMRFESGALSAISKLPGATSELPLPYLPGAQESPEADPYRLLVPIFQGYGTDLPVHARYSSPDVEPSADTEATVKGSPAIGFQFTLENSDLAFRSFSVPQALLGGQNEFQLTFLDHTIRMLAGVEVDFTTYVPGGVQSFILGAIRPSEEIDSTTPPSFDHSFRFTNDGTAIIDVVGIVPEASTMILVASSVPVLVFVVRRRMKGPANIRRNAC